MTARSRFGTNDILTGRYNAGVACADVPARVAPDRAAVVHEAAGEVTSLTFAQLAERATGLAGVLGRAGVSRGDAVAVLAPGGIAAAIAHIGVLKAGAVSLPLVPLLGDDAIAYRLADAAPRVLLVAPELEEQARRLAGGEVEVVTLEEAVLRPASEPAAVATAPGDPALLLYTSGTTGKPKGAVQPHRVVLARHGPLAMIHGPFLPDDVFWTPADWMWMGSVIDSVLAPLSHGCTVMTYERRRFDAADAVERIKALGVTKAFIPPTALRRLMEVGSDAWREHRLRSVHSGGEALTSDAADWARDELGIVVDEIYGMTEASFLVGSAHRFEAPVRGSMGRPFPGQALRVVDDELFVSDRSPSLFLGYHGKPEATGARFRDGWFATGDLVRCDADGRLFHLGRKDDLIMSSGHRIGPGEIEDALRTHADVRDAVVVGEADAERGQRVKAVVQLTSPVDGRADALTCELQDIVRERVGRHAYPRSVEYVADFPRTATGKVRRDLLRAAPGDRG